MRTFVGSTTEVSEVVAGEYTQRYEHSTDVVQVSFTSLGSVSLMANGVDKVAAATPTLGFTAITAAPVANLLVSASGFIMALGYAGHADGWWSSGLFNHEAWAPDPATQASNGTLYQTPGAITAGCQYNDDVIAFKRDATYRGRYVGVPNVWEWDVLSDTIGCVGPNAMCTTPAGVIFVGSDDIHLLSGSGIQSLGAGVRQWLGANLSRNYEALTYCQYDEVARLVYIGHPSNKAQGFVDSVLIYNLVTQSYGRLTNAGLPVGVVAIGALRYTKGSVTIDGLDDLYATTDSISVPCDTPLWKGEAPLVAVLGSDGKLYTLTGPGGTATFTLNVFGDVRQFSRLTQIVPVWYTPPTGSANNVDLLTSDDTWASLDTTKSAALFSRSFSLVKSARWFQAKFTLTGEWELVNMTFNATAEGFR